MLSIKKEKKMAPGPDGQDSCQDILAAGIHHPINSKLFCIACVKVVRAGYTWRFRAETEGRVHCSETKQVGRRGRT